MKNFYKLLLVLIICCTTVTLCLQALSAQKWEAVKETICALFSSQKKEINTKKIDVANEPINKIKKDLVKVATQKGVENYTINNTSPTAVTIAATMSAAVVTDNAPTGASATDVLEYTAVVSNSGSTDATGVTFNNTLDANTTLVAGSISSTPIATDDNYTCVGNVGLAAFAAQGLLINDVSPTNIAKTITPASGSSAHGTYSISADGTFIYTPTAGYTGADNVTYTLNTGSTSATGTVNITVSGIIWFVDASVATSGTGTLASPFKAVSNITGTAAGQNIFFYTGTYTGAFTALGTQKLIGQGATASLSSITGYTFTNAPGSLPATGGTNATWNSAALTLASGNDIEGINFNATTGIIITGASVGALKVRDVSVANTAGQAIQITAGGALDVQFKSVSAAGAAKGISVNSSTGKFEVLGTGTTAGSGGTISNITTRGAEFISCTNVTLKNMNFTNANTSTATCSTPVVDNSACNAALHLKTVTGVILDNIAVTGTSNSMGINLNNVFGFSLANSTITAAGSTNATGNETGGIYALNLAGTCAISNTNVNDSWGRGFYCYNGILSINPTVNLTVTTCQFKNSFNRSNGADNFIFNGYGSSNNTVTIKSSDFSNSKASGLQLNFGNSSVNTIQVGGTNAADGNTILAAAASPGSNGFSLQGVGNSTINYNIYNNNFQSSFNGGLTCNVGAQANCTMQGRINFNTVTGVSAFNANGISVAAYGSSTHKTEILNNTISGTKNNGIAVESNDNSAAGQTARMDATVKNNNITMLANSYAHVSVIAVANNAGTNGLKTCMNVGNNTTNTPTGLAAGQLDVLSLLPGNQVILQGASVFSPNVGADKTPSLITFWNANNVGIRTAVDEVGGGSIIAGTCLVPSNSASSRIVPLDFSKKVNKVNDSVDAKMLDSKNNIKEEFEKSKTEIAAKQNIDFKNESNRIEGLLSGETVTVNGAGSGFTLPAGKSTTIKFRASVNAAPTSCGLSTQATISGSNFSDVLSDDPAVVGAANPTNTTLTVAATTARAVSASTACIGTSVTLTATAPNGGTPTWYTASSGGTSIGTGSSLPVVVNATTSYYVSSAVGGCESTRALAGTVTATAFTLPTSALVVTQNVSNNIFNNASCALLATVLPNGSGPAVTGTVTAKVWIETTQPVQFVKRHYEITPATNAANATAKITLYFTDAEFSAFNTQAPAPALLLPISTDAPATIAARKANLRIEKRAGTGDANGTLNSYTGTVTTFNPNVADINWNATASRWEVSFDVAGFSGFWVKTQAAVLPLTLLEFTGSKTSNGNLLEWKTSSEINTKSFEIERQLAVVGGLWSVVGSQAAVGNGANSYTYTDADKLNGTVLYRLKMIDNDGKFTYSNVIKLSTFNLQLSTLYPNPITSTATLQIGDRKLLNTQATLLDANGRTIKIFTIKNSFEIVDMSGLASGLYVLKMANGEVMKLEKL
jgi:trimeric autotransporter adhesin